MSPPYFGTKMVSNDVENQNNSMNKFMGWQGKELLLSNTPPYENITLRYCFVSVLKFI